MKRYKTAIVGCGVISHVYARSIREQFRILELSACSDVNVARAQQLAQEFDLKVMTYEEMLQDDEIKIILNLTTPQAHYALTRQALMAGKHVWSEKTLAVQTREGEELCALADEHHVRLGCAPDTFLGGGLQTARYIVDHGLIGNVQSGVISLTRDFRVYGEQLPHLFGEGGSILYDVGSYYLTAVCSILGGIGKITAFGARTEDSHLVRRLSSPYYGQTFTRSGSAVVGAVLEFTNHAIVTFHMDADTDRDERRHLELYGDKGILRMGDPNTFCGENELFKVGSRPVIFPMTHGFRGEMRGLGAAEMAWSIEAGREQRAGTGLALHVLETVCGIEESIRTGEVYRMKTSCRAPEPLPEGYVGDGFWETGEEAALQ